MTNLTLYYKYTSLAINMFDLLAFLEIVRISYISDGHLEKFIFMSILLK